MRRKTVAISLHLTWNWNITHRERARTGRGSQKIFPGWNLLDKARWLWHCPSGQWVETFPIGHWGNTPSQA